jgi:dTDP-4-dehydrorhamnose reductase
LDSLQFSASEGTRELEGFDYRIGLLGRGLTQIISRKHVVLPLTRAMADVTNLTAVAAIFRDFQPDSVIHAAALPDPDFCELNPAEAQRVNVEGTRNAAEVARGQGSSFAFISSDAVFDGRKRTPYVETDPVDPPTVYGQTKVAGEGIARSLERHWIFRIPVLFGPGKLNFVEKGLRKIAKGEEYIVAADQLACAAYTLDVAAKMIEVISSAQYGTFHIANTGECNRLELARRAATLAGMDASKITGKPIAEMGRPAKRLQYSVMELRALKQRGFALPRPWPEALAGYLHARA